MSIRPLALVALVACAANAEPPPDMFTTLSEADLKKPGLIKDGAIQLAVLSRDRVVCYAPLVAPYFLQRSPRWKCDDARRRCVGGPNVVYWEGNKIAAFVDYKIGEKDYGVPATKDSAAITDEVDGHGPACTAARAANGLTAKDDITDLWDYVDITCQPGDACLKPTHYCGQDAGKQFASWWTSSERHWGCDRTLACDAAVGFDYWVLLRKAKGDRLLPWLVGRLDSWTTEADVKPRADRFAAFTKTASTTRCP